MDWEVLKSDADLAQEIVQGDKLQIVYDVQSSNPYWLGIWADEIDKSLSKVSIYDVTGYTQSGSTITFNIIIKPFAVRMADGKAVSIDDLRRLNAGQPALGEPVQANVGAILILISVAVISVAIWAGLREIRIKHLGYDPHKSTMESVDDLAFLVVMGLALWLAYEVFVKGRK